MKFLDLKDCPFCGNDDVVIKNDLAYARWDIFPVNEGHMLIVPFRHVENYFDLSEKEQISILKLVNSAKDLIQEMHKPDAFNIGINAGLYAGQTVPHVHVHLIPRYKGDMDDPRGGVRGVIPEKQKFEI